jgi:MSHA biogenesis protein MshQ
MAQNTEVTDEVTTLAGAPVNIGSTPMRYGRAAFGSAVGSELVNLAVPFRTEYYVDASTGFVTNVNDFCSSGAALSFSNFADNLNAGETCVEDIGSPGVSGGGCTTVGPVTQQYFDPLVAGDFNLFLRAPGAGNDGSATVEANVPAWLEFDWDTGVGGDEDPSGRVTFGIYGGDKNQVYRRELY